MPARIWGSGYSDRTEAERVLQRYAPGQKVACMYDPADPSDVFFGVPSPPRADPMWTFALLGVIAGTLVFSSVIARDVRKAMGLAPDP